jgi:hypothetical protein
MSRYLMRSSILLALLAFVFTPLYAQNTQQIIFTAPNATGGADIYLFNGTIEAPIAALNYIPDRIAPSPDGKRVLFEGFAQQGISCPNIMASRMIVGNPGRVVPGPANRIRQEPNRNATIVGQLAGGKLFTVFDGPVCADNLAWWQIRTEDGINGWTAEGADGDYWIEPLDMNPAGIRLITMIELGAAVTIRPFVVGVRASWSPDSTRMVYVAEQTASEPGNMFTIFADGTNRQFLGAGSYPAWSPDGTQIAYIGDLGNRNYQIFLISPDGVTTRSLSTVTGVPEMPVWSPNGQQIAVRVKDNVTSLQTLTIVDVNSSNVRKLTDGFFADYGWSPNGQRFGFVESTSGYMLNAIDSTFTQPFNPISVTGSPYIEWSADGNALLHTSDPATTNPGIFTISPVNKASAIISKRGGIDVVAAWLPGNITIVIQGVPTVTPSTSIVVTSTPALISANLPSPGTWLEAWTNTGRIECAGTAYWISMGQDTLKIEPLPDQTGFKAISGNSGSEMQMQVQLDGSFNGLDTDQLFFYRYKVTLTSPTEAQVAIEIEPQKSGTGCKMTNTGTWVFMRR